MPQLMQCESRRFVEWQTLALFPAINVEQDKRDPDQRLKNFLQDPKGET